MTTTSTNNEKDKQSNGESATLDVFVSSMTFASGELPRGCDCEECERIPPTIRDAIARHKRRKLISQPILRMQFRALVIRKDDVSIWKWKMPLDAEPLVEFGNSFRIVYVDDMPEESVVMAIGKGIIGSSEETKNRSRVDWMKQKAYIIPPNGGKALGWIHTSRDEGAKRESGHLLMYNIKSSLSQNEIHAKANEDGGVGDSVQWLKQVYQVLSRAIHGTRTENDEDEESDGSIPGGTPLNESDAGAIAHIIKQIAVSGS